MQCEDNFGWLGGDLRCQIQKFVSFFDTYRVASNLQRIGHNVSDKVYPKKLHIFIATRKGVSLDGERSQGAYKSSLCIPPDNCTKNTQKSYSRIVRSKQHHRKNYTITN